MTKPTDPELNVDPTVESGIEPAAPTNGFATAGVVLGLLACVPGTGLIGLPLSVLGARRATRLGGVGRPQSLLGMALGLINLLWWSAILFGALQTGRAMKKSEPIIHATAQFVLLVGKGDLDKAKTFCGPDITDEQLETLQEQLGLTGQMQQSNPYHGGQVHLGGRDIEIWCQLTFDTGKRVLITHWDPRLEPAKLTKFQLMDAAATQPATVPSR